MLIPVIDPGMIIKRPERWLGTSEESELDLDELQEIENSGERYAFFQRRDDVHVGMEVTIVRSCHDYAGDWENTWADGMDEFIGKSGIVTNVSRSGLYIPGLTSCYHWPWRVCIPTTKQGAFPFYYADPLHGLPLSVPKEINVMAVDPRLVDSDDFLFMDGKVIEKKKRRFN